MSKKEAYKKVYDDLMNVDLFKGTYDAKNGSEKYMHGIMTVMEIIAQGVSEACYNEFGTMFCKNMEKSEKKAKKKSKEMSKCSET